MIKVLIPTWLRGVLNAPSCGELGMCQKTEPTMILSLFLAKMPTWYRLGYFKKFFLMYNCDSLKLFSSCEKYLNYLSAGSSQKPVCFQYAQSYLFACLLFLSPSSDYDTIFHGEPFFSLLNPCDWIGLAQCGLSVVSQSTKILWMQWWVQEWF